MNVLTFVAPAGRDERFAPDAFAGVVGSVVPFNLAGEVTPGLLVSAVVAEDGSSVLLTVEWEDET